MTAPPTHLLGKLLEQRVQILLKDGRSIAGRLVGADEHLNLVIDEAQETAGEVGRRLGRIVLRGSSVVSMHAPATTPGHSVA